MNDRYRVTKVAYVAVSICSALLCSMILPFAAHATDYYVKPATNGGSNAYSGLDWNNAKATIGAAMALADGDDNIYVAAGSYNEKISFPQANNIALRGGYPAAAGTTQNPAANPTVIDGSGLSSPGPMILIPMQTSGASGYSGIVIEGFTIRNGTRTAGLCAGIESYSLGVTIKRNVIENNEVTGTGGWAGGIYIFAPLNDKGKTIIEQNIVRNNAAAAVGGIYLEGAAGRTERYFAYLVNNLIHGNRSTTTDPDWPRGVGGIDVMYPASASIVNCTVADNSASHPTNAIGGISISGYSATEKGIAAIANSIIWHQSGKDIKTTADGTLWIAYSAVKDAAIGGTGVIHGDPQFAPAGDYRLTETSPCKNTASTMGTVLSGSIAKSPFAYLPCINFKNPPYNYSDAQVTLSWGDGVHNLAAQWQYDRTLDTTVYGKFFGSNNANCTADPSPGVAVSNMAGVDASSYSYSTSSRTATYNSWPGSPKQTVFWRGKNGYYGAWTINTIGVTTFSPYYGGRLSGLWYFQTNGGPYFDSGIRTVDLEGTARPAETGYDMGAYEYAPDTAPPTGSIAINGGAACTKTTDVTLSLSAHDPSGVEQMQFANENLSWSAPEPYSGAKSWDLSQGYGTKTAYVKFKDNLDNWSAPIGATIAYPAPGDFNNSGEIELTDVLVILQVTAEAPFGSSSGFVCAAISGNDKIGLQDAVYVLQVLSGLRQ